MIAQSASLPYLHRFLSSNNNQLNLLHIAHTRMVYHNRFPIEKQQMQMTRKYRNIKNNLFIWTMYVE